MPIIFAFGASKGIGSVFCKKAIEKGYKIVLFSRTNPYNIKSDFVSVDFLNEDDFLMKLNLKITEYKTVDHLVFSQKYRGEPNLDKEITLNIKTIINTIECVKNKLTKSIVMVSSSAARLVTKTQSVEYHVAKAGIESLVRYYAINLDRIRVNAVSPTVTIKPENMEFYKNNPKLVKQYEQIYPLQKMPEASDVAEAILWLLNAPFINGEVIKIDAGVNLIEIETLIKR
ncbi:SDR family oxidoreductase [Campylobacter fetus]|uniref:SDR family oxidoreductase n=1 Tax=Campylobacter fetus TaxID=196 RepID=UPI000818C3BA|nr:SDR family oxidoreductase [Campylobacter fetus]EAK0827479.1 SDR family oxidoreductase [Campylobacter fetus]